MKKLAISLATLLTVSACSDRQLPTYRLPNGNVINIQAYDSDSFPGHVRLDDAGVGDPHWYANHCDDKATILAKSEIKGIVEHIGPLKTPGGMNNLTQVAVGGNGLIGGGSAKNVAMSVDEIVIIMRPLERGLSRYVMNVRGVPGPHSTSFSDEYTGISPRLLLDTVHKGSIIGVTPLRGTYDGLILLHPTDVYSPECIKVY